MKLTNTGLGIMQIANYSVSKFFRQTNDCASTLSPGASCTLTMSFKPQYRGAITGSVSIAYNAPDSPEMLALGGTGTVVELSPTSVNFGNQPIGTSSLTQTITLSNKGESAFNLTGIAIVGADPGDFTQTNNCGSTIASGASCFIQVTFKPAEAGRRAASISVTDDGGGSPQIVKLVGIGT